MQPFSLRDGPTNARSSASSRVSWLSRARRITTSVTASFGSFSCPLERDLRAIRFVPERLGAARFALRLAIMAGIVLQLAKTASGFKRCISEQARNATGLLFLGELAAGVQA